MSSSTGGRVDLSSIVRGLVAVQVVVWHTIGYSLDGGLWNVIEVSGRQCVWIFFALSGYFVSHGFFIGRYDLHRTHDIVDYSLARLFRIVPLYLFVTVVTFAILHLSPVADRSNYGSVGWASFFSALVFMPTESTYPSVFWTIVLEMQFYLLVPLVIWLYRQVKGRRPRHVPGAAIILGVYLLLAAVPRIELFLFNVPLDNRSLLGNASHFFAGVAAHDLAEWQPFRRFLARPDSTRWLAGTALAVLILTNVTYHTRGFWTLGALLTDVTSVCILLVHRKLEGVPRGRIGILLGAPSALAYGLYAWHGTLLTAVPSLLGHLPMVLAISLGLALMSYWLLEQPALRVRRRLIKRRFLGSAEPS